MATRWKRPKTKAVDNSTDSSQASIFDLAEQNKLEGMTSAYQNANLDWKAAATKYLSYLCRTQAYVTSEDVVLYLKDEGITTHENRAMGGIMTSFANAGIIKATGRFTTSRRPECHKSPVRIWESRVYKEN